MGLKHGDGWAFDQAMALNGRNMDGQSRAEQRKVEQAAPVTCSTPNAALIYFFLFNNLSV